MSTVAGNLNELNTSSNRKWLVGLGAIALIAYWNSFTGVFLWDDNNFSKSPIFESPTWYAQAFIFPLDRRILQLTFTLNNWFGVTNVWTYHAVNLLIHTLSGLALFGVVRKTLEAPRIATEFRQASRPLAFVSTAIFLVHPLQTESVTFIVQRAQALMGMLGLVGFYAFIRGCETQKPMGWFAISIASLAIGLTSKPHFVAMPAILGLYDIIFISGSIRESFRLRKAYYILLSLGWIFILANVGKSLEQHSDIGNMALDSDKVMTFWEYALSQFGVLTYYIYLIFVPVNLCLDYAWPLATEWRQIIPPAVFIVSLIALNLWALFRYPAWGFVGAWFFMQILPISLIPRPDLAVEHRLYLPLAAFSTLAVLLVFSLAGKFRQSAWNLGDSRDWRQRAYIFSSIAILTLCVLTMTRNIDYHSSLRMYSDVVSKVPDNARAHNNLANEYLKARKPDIAKQHILRAIQLKPSLVAPRRQLVAYYWAKGQYDEMLASLKTLEPVLGKDADYHCYLSAAHRELGHYGLARAELQKALEIDPACPDALKMSELMAAGGK